MSKIIYKNDRIGDVKGKFVDNEYRGVFLKPRDIFHIRRENPNIPNILYSENRNDNYTYKYNYVRYTPYSVGQQVISGITVSWEYWAAEANDSHTFNYVIPINYISDTPIEGVTASQISVNFVYDETRNTTSPIVLAASGYIRSFVDSNRTSYTAIEPIGTSFPKPSAGLWNYDTITKSEMRMPIDVSPTLSIDNFAVRFTINMNMSLNGTYLTEYNYNSLQGGVTVPNRTSIRIYEPKYIEITIRGDTYRVAPIDFVRPKNLFERMYEIQENTLITTRTTRNGIPYTEYIYDKIAGANGEWINGKRCFNIEVIAPFDLHQIQDSIKILQSRKGEINESNPTEVNNASILNKPNGEAIEMEITSAEFRYNGANRQILDVVEKL